MASRGFPTDADETYESILELLFLLGEGPQHGKHAVQGPLKEVAVLYS